MSVVVARGEFQAALLKRLRPHEQQLMVLAGHISNEVSVVQKILVACMNYRGQAEASRDAYPTQNLIVAKVLAGKLVEGWKAIKAAYYGSQLSREVDPLLIEDAKLARDELRKYFGSKNLLTRVRNSAAFHYSGDGIAVQVARLPDDTPLRIYVAEETGNSLYFFAEQPMFMQAFAESGERTMQQHFDDFLRDGRTIARAMATFLQGLLIVLWERMAPDEMLVEQELPAGDYGSLHETRIPFFLAKGEHSD